MNPEQVLNQNKQQTPKWTFSFQTKQKNNKQQR